MNTYLKWLLHHLPDASSISRSSSSVEDVIRVRLIVLLFKTEETAVS